MVARYTVLILFIIINQFSFSQHINVESSTDKKEYLVGDYINYTLLIKAQKDVFIINPFFRDSLKNVEVIKISDPVITESDSVKTIKYICTLSRYDSASVTIPPIQVQYRVKGDTTLNAAYSNPVNFRVNKISVSMQEDIKDIKPPVRIPFNYLLLVLYVLAGLIIVVILYSLYKKYWKKKEIEEPQPKEPKLLPNQLALKKLESLEREELWQKGEVKEYHSRITEIIREYFEKRFGFPALELTTSETLEFLEKHSRTRVIKELTSAFLNNADMVKFAKYIPLSSINSEMMVQAKEIVNRSSDGVQQQYKEGADNA